MTSLDRELLLRAFRRVADELEVERVRAEAVLAGGAVVALLFDATRVTRDVDGLVVEGHGPLTKATQRVAAELKLPRGWFNEGVAAYLSTEPDPGRAVVFDHPNLTMYAVSADHMLALKARAARAQDLGDLRLLADAVGAADAAAVLAVVDQFFPDDPISDRARSVIEDLFDS